MANKVNSSRFKLILVEIVSGSPVDKAITEQLTFTGSRSTNTIDVTSKDNNGYDEFIGGLKSGEWNFDYIVDLSVPANSADKANYLKLSAIEAARTVATFKAKLDDGLGVLSITFNGLITKFDTSAPLEDKITCSVTLKRSGAPTEAYVPAA